MIDAELDALLARANKYTVNYKKNSHFQALVTFFNDKKILSHKSQSDMLEIESALSRERCFESLCNLLGEFTICYQYPTIFLQSSISFLSVYYSTQRPFIECCHIS